MEWFALKLLHVKEFLPEKKTIDYITSLILRPLSGQNKE